MTAAERFLAEIEARTLDVPEELVDELRQWCRVGEWFLPRLLERLLDGAAVLDARGGMNAPQRLWDRWEAILQAYVILRYREEEERTRKPRRRRQAIGKLERS